MPTALLGPHWLREALTCRRPSRRDGGPVRPIARRQTCDRRWRWLVAILLLIPMGAAHADPKAEVLTSAGAIHNLPLDQAARSIPVHLVATVTYYAAQEHVLFVEDA